MNMRTTNSKLKINKFDTPSNCYYVCKYYDRNVDNDIFVKTI